MLIAATATAIAAIVCRAVMPSFIPALAPLQALDYAPLTRLHEPARSSRAGTDVAVDGYRGLEPRLLQAPIPSRHA
jgi:hypothetical protein